MLPKSPKATEYARLMVDFTILSNAPTLPRFQARSISRDISSTFSGIFNYYYKFQVMFIQYKNTPAGCTALSITPSPAST
jgi:hypothetical protein